MHQMLLFFFSFIQNALSSNSQKILLNSHSKSKFFSKVKTADAQNMLNQFEHWEYDQNNHILTIFGKGYMNHYSKSNPAPWNDYSNSIEIINIQNDVNSIGSYAFYNFKSLKQVKFGNKLALIEKSSFSNCENLELIEFPDSLITIEKSAFYKCSNLKTIKFGNQLKTIHESAFSFCTKIESLIIPSTVRSIESNAFQSCTSLSHVTYMGENEPRFGFDVFNGCNSLSYISVHYSYQSKTFCKKQIKHLSNYLLDSDPPTATDIPTPTEIPYPSNEKMKNKKVPMIVAYTIEFVAIIAALIVLYIFSRKRGREESESSINDSLMSQVSLI